MTADPISERPGLGRRCWSKVVLEDGRSVVYRVYDEPLRGAGGSERDPTSARLTAATG